MTDTLEEAKGHIQALAWYVKWLSEKFNGGDLPPDYEPAVAFLTHLDGDGQTGELFSPAPLTQADLEWAAEEAAKVVLWRNPAPNAAAPGPAPGTYRIIEAPAAGMSQPDPRIAREAVLEEAAVIADAYADENIRMAGDTVLHDPAFKPGPKDWAKSQELTVKDCIHSSMFHAAQNIAAAIRALKDHTGSGV